ncbi:hypothetical protein [Ascidiaceihabitans sp.]|uniref:hypothetical protein n=1 Tax=Ascidiaceihabitans sp. TaxID=1872644 RepID=UPI00329A5485
MRRATARSLIALSILLSVLAVLTIVWTWSQTTHNLPGNMHTIVDATALERHIAKDVATAAKGAQASAARYRVPTGVFVQSVAFVSSTDVNLTGYIWQKFPKDFPFTRNFDIPEEVASEETVIEERYRDEVLVGGVPHDLVGSYFDVTVRQSFNYVRYPLDHLTIWLRLWPANVDHRDTVQFVPDFDSYSDTRGDVFGLDGDLVQGEWSIERTFFSYATIPYDTNFGLNEKDKDVVHSEFFFNLSAERKFINAFIINLVPLLVISLLLFSTLMTISGNRDQAERFGFNTTGVLGTCSGLFFLVLLSHIQVRSLFPGSGLVYIEYFYLTLYGMILLVALNGYLFSLKRLEHNGALHWGDNFVAKVSFWPILLWALAFSTMYML